jgi:hypothetical protein
VPSTTHSPGVAQEILQPTAPPATPPLSGGKTNSGRPPEAHLPSDPAEAQDTAQDAETAPRHPGQGRPNEVLQPRPAGPIDPTRGTKFSAGRPSEALAGAHQEQPAE